MKFFYATTNGVGQNDENLPKPVLRKLTGSQNVLRFAFDENSKKVYIQDNSSNKAIRNGSRVDIDMLDHALSYLDRTFDARFLDKVVGDAPGKVSRKASSYKKAWAIISRAMREDLGVEPFDVNVVESTPEDAGQDGYSDPAMVRKASIEVNMASPPHREATDGDVDYDKINKTVARYYLDNVEDLARETLDKDQLKDFEERWKRHVEGGKEPTLFAVMIDGAPKILRPKNDEHFDERKVRAAKGMEGYSGPVVAFSFDRDRREIKVKNHTLGQLYEDQTLKAMVASVKHTLSSTSRIPEAEMVLTFDPTLSSPYVTTLNRYRAVWDYVKNVVSKAAGTQAVPVAVAELPIDVKGKAALVTSPGDEDKKAPGSREYRQAHNVSVEYPFIVADNRSKDTGVTGRALIDGYADFIREVQKVPYSNNWITASDDDVIRQIRHMMRLGMTREEVVDFLAPRKNLAKRAEVRTLATRAWQAMRKSAAVPPKKTAKIDTNINDWWHIGSQESLNRAQHTDGLKPFNLKGRKDKGKPKTYEELLHDLHDPDMPAQKTTEQLLKESRT
jgi:hypothetical protein